MTDSKFNYIKSAFDTVQLPASGTIPAGYTAELFRDFAGKSEAYSNLRCPRRIVGVGLSPARARRENGAYAYSEHPKTRLRLARVRITVLVSDDALHQELRLNGLADAAEVQVGVNDDGWNGTGWEFSGPVRSGVFDVQRGVRELTNEDDVQGYVRFKKTLVLPELPKGAPPTEPWLAHMPHFLVLVELLGAPP